MSKEKHDCQVCGALFERINDKMIHYIREHDADHRPGSPKNLWRTVSCWRCAKQMPRGEDGRYRCECGFLMPRKERGTNVWIHDEAPDNV